MIREGEKVDSKSQPPGKNSFNIYTPGFHLLVFILLFVEMALLITRSYLYNFHFSVLPGNAKDFSWVDWRIDWRKGREGRTWGREGEGIERVI